MEASEAVEQANKAGEAAEARERFVRRTAILVGVLAAILAVAAIAGNHAGEEVILNQEKATDTFNEYQADRLKMRMDTQNAATLIVITAGSANQAAAATQAAEWRKEAKDHYGPKVKELLQKANDYQSERDLAEAKHKALEFAEAVLQIGIVLATVAIVARVVALTYVAAGLGLVGLLLLLDGFTLAVRFP
ncbi:MAG: DUF4337 domain-containing protein [Candidatus Dormibacteraeota bacterium]|nr:DUF4337 domain-containing protein [Candidatus Dormibacteraeota bacterium]